MSLTVPVPVVIAPPFTLDSSRRHFSHLEDAEVKYRDVDVASAGETMNADSELVADYMRADGTRLSFSIHIGPRVRTCHIHDVKHFVASHKATGIVARAVNRPEYNQFIIIPQHEATFTGFEFYFNVICKKDFILTVAQLQIFTKLAKYMNHADIQVYSKFLLYRDLPFVDFVDLVCFFYMQYDGVFPNGVLNLLLSSNHLLTKEMWASMYQQAGLELVATIGSSLHAREKVYRERIEEFERQIEDKDEEITEADERETDLTDKIDDMQDKTDEVQEKLDEAIAERIDEENALKARIKELESGIDFAKDRLRSLDRDLDDFSGDYISIELDAIRDLLDC